MSRKHWIIAGLGVSSTVALLTVAGCQPTSQPSGAGAPATATLPPATSQSDAASQSGATAQFGATAQSAASDAAAATEMEEEHAHKPGAHGGIMVSLGRDSYHVEAVVENDGTIRLYTLGKDETRVIDIESQTLKGFVKADGASDSQSISFEPSPQEGDGPERTSLFIGQLPSDLVGSDLDVTIPNIRIAGERFRLGFQTAQDAHGDSPEMPSKIANDEERELYLTEGGRYTAADIQANGNVTASQKFKGMMSAHDMNPKPGDRLCPITETKANAKFSWMVDGKSYQFCCPPCVDEFLVTAKASTEPLPDPDTFIK